jgi:Na+/H+ antiporter NhaD/arsenite permease-like protein
MVVAALVLVVFIGTYLAISSEKVNRTATSLLGMGLVGIILMAGDFSTFSEMVEHIEWHTILFVTSMMAIIAVASSSGMFQYLALTLSRPTGCDTRRLYITFLAVVFGMSLFFDTVSTMLIMGPLSIEVCKALEIDFKPFLVSEAVVCNFASIPSIVGAVPNLVIADQTNLDAGVMFILLMPLAIILFVVSLPLFLRYFDEALCEGQEHLISQMMRIDPLFMIRSRRDFYASIIAVLMLVLGFTFGQSSGIEPAMFALVIAASLLMVARESVDDLLAKINWGTIFFLVGLFGMVAALEIVGLIDALGEAVGALIGNNEVFAVIFMIWVPGVLSAIIDNIPVSAVLAPIAVDLAPVSPLLPIALIFGVNIGGFLLPIGSPANILAIALAEKEHQPISFQSFLKIATPIGILLMLIGTGWLALIAFIL